MTNLKILAHILQEERGFDAKDYLNKKSAAINDFFRHHNLDAAVVGISGGVDSAVVYNLLSYASKLKDSPILSVHGMILPIKSAGTTNQSIASNYAFDVVNACDNLKCTYSYHDLSSVCQEYIRSANVSQSIKNDYTPWEIGQLASIVRTPMLYFKASTLQMQGYKSIVVGTTNRDEGSYIGFYGKASDGMVDLQPIADLHKSEVYKLAKLLNIPKSIISRKPMGDVHDGRTDEEMIGAPYWFIEMYTGMKNIPFLSFLINTCFRRDKDVDSTDVDVFERAQIPLITVKDKVIFNSYMDAVEQLHKQNKHKYQVGSPAHFIDVMERKVKGGWN